MSYIGKVDMNDANIEHYSLTGSTLTTVNIGWTPASEQSLRVTINGVVQQGDTFSYSGANLTLGGPLIVTDTLEVVGIQSVGNIITPADDSVTTAKLADDAVTTVKINDDAVTLAKMAGLARGKIIVGDASGDPSALTVGASTQILTSDGTDAAWAAAPAGGLTTASQWRLTTQFTNDAEPIASNLEQADAPVGFGVLGSSMTESSGIFTFPSTGYWYITFQHNFAGNTNVYEKETHCKIMTTTNNSTYAVAADGVQSSGQNNPNNVRGSASTSYIFDVTDTANCKVRFDILVADSGTTTLGSTDYLRTGMTFIKLADT